MTTSVLERISEIGIMKAIGARNEHIFFQFLIESGLLGFIGGVIGVFLGLGIGELGIMGLNNFLGSEISLVLDYFFISLVLFLSFLVGALSGIVPALQASRKNPVEAIRK
jgi:putative ABC transport system permease protein